MILIKLTGGLGNQMFQYALGRVLSLKNNSQLKLDTSIYNTDQSGITARKYVLGVFDIKENFTTKFEISKLSTSNKLFKKIGLVKKTHYIEKEANIFDRKIMSAVGDIYLDGYWQAEKYFIEYRDQILKDFTLKNKLSESVKKIENEILNTNSISLHIRRGDYVTDQKTNKFHGLCSLDYYKKAIKYITDKNSNCIFYIFSDDIEWVKNNLKIDNKTVYVSNGSIQDYEELYLMSQCRHNIIANSSFSWWGAWLNKDVNKVVIAPKKWDNSGKSNDIVPGSWIKL